MSFDVHLRDVMSIVSYLLRARNSANDSSLSMSVFSTYVFDFIVLRCYRKLYARLVSGITLWTQHPLEALFHYYHPSSTATQESSPPVAPEPPVSGDRASLRDTDQVLPPAVGQDSPLCAKMPRAYAYIDLLEEHGITYTMEDQPMT